jgi:hypothetical protein
MKSGKRKRGEKSPRSPVIARDRKDMREKLPRESWQKPELQRKAADTAAHMQLTTLRGILAAGIGSQIR